MVVKALELFEVTKIYNYGNSKIVALQDVSMHVDKGDMICIVGPSGSGKTTLLKVSSGLLKPDKGKVRLLGVDIYDLSLDERMKIRREKTSFMPQEDILIETLTALENVELPLIIEGVPRKRRREIARSALNIVGLTGKEDRLPQNLSGGERRRVSLARCLTKKPLILFADEPTSNLDSENSLMVIDILREINKQGITIMVSSHDPLVANAFNKVFHIRDGILRLS